MQNNKINYVELPASKLDKTKVFFNRVFGWTFVDYGPEYSAFENAGLDGGFFKSEKSSLTHNGSALVVLYSDNLNVIKDTIIEHGGVIVQDIFVFPGGKRFHFLDPSNNEFAVWSDR
ncbi:VOC family protein [Marinomonas sp. 15G1-11]|uniref:VOC family protein n=1 Tax=Marinomonas phaeophyticola TaxID=3004091 RepID=A0ABT4JRS5_9GAMM|nr:VOC family protein [Marinomonas sp. 15G1-11]MCZ2720881.1 VOC family protein [Marinomonas sp. 15G1-11]